MPQWIYNAFLALWLLSDAFRVARASLVDQGLARCIHWLLILILVANAVFALRRPAPVRRAVTGWQVGWIIVAMAWPVFFNLAPAPPGPTPLPALVLQLAATLMFGASVIQLGESFAVFPERRAIVTSGMYAWVRHPMYSSYLLLDLGLWLANPQPWFALVWVVELLLFEARTRWEEGLLGEDATYAAYQQQVRWRLIPGVF